MALRDFFILFRSILIIFFKVDSSKAVCPIDVSSAKSLLSLSMSSAMSFMNTKHNRRNQQDELSFDFDGIVLNSVNKHKHLGIIFTSDY
jgi:hypothetical protein